RFVEQRDGVGAVVGGERSREADLQGRAAERPEPWLVGRSRRERRDGALEGSARAGGITAPQRCVAGDLDGVAVLVGAQSDRTLDGGECAAAIAERVANGGELDPAPARPPHKRGVQLV